MASGDSAFAFQDPLTRMRLNRAWIIGRSNIPMFDVDVNDALSVTPRSIAGTVLTTSAAALYTVPGSGVTVTQIHSITVTNFSVTARKVNIYLGSSAVVATQIWGDTLQPGESAIIEGPWYLSAGQTLQASAEANTSIALTGELLEYKTQPASLTLKVINGVTLGTGASVLYSTPSSGVRQAVVLAITLFNSHTANLTPTIYRVPSGNSESTARVIFNSSMFTKESAVFGGPFTLGANDFISGLAGTAGLVSARLTVIEAA